MVHFHQCGTQVLVGCWLSPCARIMEAEDQKGVGLASLDPTSYRIHLPFPPPHTFELKYTQAI